MAGILGFFRSLFYRIFSWSLSLLYGTLVLARLVLGTIFRPSKRFWFIKEREVPPKCLSDPAYGTHKVMQLKDIKLHYVESGDSSKPLVLFVHGFPEFWFSWRYQIKELCSDYWTVALDMRGFGDSDKPDGTISYNTRNLVNDLKELVESLGRKTFILVAHDWGGAVAWHFLYTHPEMVDKFVIMGSPHPKGFRSFIFSNLKQFFMSWYIFFYQLPYLPEIFMRSYDMAILSKLFKGPLAKNPLSNEDVEAYKYTFGKSGAFTGPINYYRANFGGAPFPKKPEDDLPPGMLIGGENDRYVSLESMEMTKRDIPHLRIEVVQGANHFVQQDDPEAVNKLLRSFLRT